MSHRTDDDPFARDNVSPETPTETNETPRHGFDTSKTKALPEGGARVAAGEAPTMLATDGMNVEKKVAEFRKKFQSLRDGVKQAMIGQEDVIDATLIAMIVGGHVLLEGVPGLGKTFLVRTLSKVLQLDFNRIQFTPDLMPADIVGTNLVVEGPQGGKEFKFQPGPIFTNLCLADEINRATPKTQSALLEAMQEKSVTTGGEIRQLDRPFFVLATQNPLEMEGTYPLPEAQLDRFFFKINVEYPKLSELGDIVRLTTGTKGPEVNSVMAREEFLSMQEMVGAVPVADHVMDFGMRVVMASQPSTEHATDLVRRFVSYGSSPRGAQSIVLAAKARALLEGRVNVSFADIEWAALPALRHRIILNFEGEAEGVSTDDIVADILGKVPKDRALTGAL